VQHVTRPRPARSNGRRRVAFVAGAQGGTDDTVTPEAVGAGTIRGLVLTQSNSVAGPPPFSWVDNPRIFLPRTLRYRASTRFRGVGSDRTINAADRPMVRWRVQQSAVTRQVGNKPAGPTVRNRLASFGSRVPPLNAPSPNATTSPVVS
jgi:hypothetical protein